MTYELHETDPYFTVQRVTIPVRALGIAKLVIVRKEKTA